MSKTNEGANASFRGMSRPYPLYAVKNTSVFRNVRVTDRTQVDNYLLVKRGAIVGGEVTKDMDNENYTEEFDPFNLQEVLFPGMADFIDENIVLGDKNEEDRLIASYWNDLGNDVFDDWGYFFLYDVEGGKYYFPLLNPQNLSDGIITTQNFNNVFDEGLNFTISHGWRAKGIFMMNISCSNAEFIFRFGAYGNFGSDGDENDYDMSTEYTYDGVTQTLFYHHHAEEDDDEEILYSYFIPYKSSDRVTKTHTSLYNPEDTDDNSLITKAISGGVKVYFAKQNDVKDWVITDITTEDFSDVNGDIKAEGDITNDGNIYSAGSILAAGYNLGRTTIYNLSDENFSPSNIVNTYFTSSGLSEDRTFFLPNSSILFNLIPNCQDETSFKFTINNYNNIEGGYSWTLSNEFSDLNMSGVKNYNIPPGGIVTYIVVLRTGEGTYGYVLQESELQYYP
jgi:hypothetical protein